MCSSESHGRLMRRKWLPPTLHLGYRCEFRVVLRLADVGRDWLLFCRRFEIGEVSSNSSAIIRYYPWHRCEGHSVAGSGGLA